MTPEQAFALYHRDMLRLAGKWFGLNDADDAVSIMWVNAVAHWCEFRGDSSVTTWLSRILMNGWIMELRKRKTREMVNLPLVTGYDAAVPAGFDTAMEDDSEQRLSRVMARLRPKYRGYLIEWAKRDRHCVPATTTEKVRVFRAIQEAKRIAA